MAQKKTKSVEGTLEQLRDRIDAARVTKTGDIDLHLSGEAGGDYRISAGPGAAALTAAAPRAAGSEPLLEVWADAETIRAIVDGKKDPIKQFLLGRMRVRGDLRYLSDLGVELGIFEKPL